MASPAFTVELVSLDCVGVVIGRLRQLVLLLGFALKTVRRLALMSDDPIQSGLELHLKIKGASWGWGFAAGGPFALDTESETGLDC